VILRSQQAPVTFEALEAQGAQNKTFRNFRARLAAWLTVTIPLYSFSFAPDCTRVEFQVDDKITEYRSMKVWYESMVDWRQYLDYLYCSPNFHGQERHDFVILKTTDGFIFAELLFIFTTSSKDINLRLRRLCPKSSTEFFFVQSIVRGAPLIPTFDNMSGDYLVMDVVDHNGDLFVRCNEIF
ncbi:hypothetical protein EDB89DRAFT_1833379, partial [Lactarius sanguifluus]